MPKLKILSGKDLIRIFSRFDFKQDSQKGSHVKLVRIRGERKQILVIPYKKLAKGTLKAIYRQATRYIPEEELEEYFYN